MGPRSPGAQSLRGLGPSHLTAPRRGGYPWSMKKLLLSAALASNLLAPASAQTVAHSPTETASWVGPMAAAVTAAGSERISGLGSVSLTALSLPNANGQLPFVAAHEALAPLAEEIKAQGLTPESFAALPTAQKLAVLTRAAAPAEAKAAAVADAALISVAEPVRIGTYEDASAKTTEASRVALYLSAEKAQAVAAARAEVKSFEKLRSKNFKSFTRDLPARLAAGEFDGSNLVRRDADGWYAADEAPETRYETLEDFYDSRLKRVAASPAGPWTVAQYDLLKKSISAPIAAKLDAAWDNAVEDLGMRILRNLRSLLPSYAYTRAIDKDRAAAATWRDQPKLKAALVRFEKGSPRERDIRAVEKFYDSALDRGWSDWTQQAHILAKIQTGGEGLPSWEGLKTLRREAQARYHRGAWRGLVGYIAAMGTAIAIGASNLPAAAKIAAFALLITPLAWMFLNIWRRDDFHFEADSIDMRLNRRGFDD
jgi:hypothetical protein